jgi:hypothetical protein
VISDLLRVLSVICQGCTVLLFNIYPLIFAKKRAALLFVGPNERTCTPITSVAVQGLTDAPAKRTPLLLDRENMNSAGFEDKKLHASLPETKLPSF